MNLAEAVKAEKRIRPHLPITPIEAGLGEGVFFKLENLNLTRSFKIRGALNAMLALSAEEKSSGIVAASAGNHAQGISYAARLSGIPATIVMPNHTPKRKVEGTARYGANVILHGEGYTETENHALALQKQTGMTFVSPYNHPHVIAGQGTIGLELLEQLPQLERVLIPVSGGGLIAGIGAVCKALNPDCEVVGVQSVTTPAMYNYFYGENLPAGETIAEGLEGDIEAGSITLELCKNFTDRIVLVEEKATREAIRWMLETHNWVIEGAAAVGIAALQTGVVPLDGRTTAVIISGANLDYTTLQSLLR